MVKAVFFSCLLYDQARLCIIDERDPEKQSWRGISCPTAMTDGYNLVVNMEFFGKLTVDERIFVLAHEIYHIMAMHPKRMRKYAVEGLFNLPFLPGLYNIAADTVINKCLTDSVIGKCPAGCVAIKEIGTYKVTGMETAEEIYKLLLAQLPPGLLTRLGKMGTGDPGVGEIDRGIGMPGRTENDPLGNDVIPVSPDPAAEHVNEAGMKAAIQAAQQQAKSQGTMPAGLKRFIDQFLEPQVHWEDILRLTVVAKAGTSSTTWSKPNRRKIVTPGVYLPRRRGMRAGPVVCAIDTSGSVSETELRQFLGEVSSILGDIHPEHLTLIWCDARVDGVEELEDPEELRIATVVKGAGGGGGTSFIPPFEYIRDEEVPCHTMIYFTDGFGPFPSPDLAPFETIWCISNDKVQPPFGTRVEVTWS